MEERSIRESLGRGPVNLLKYVKRQTFSHGDSGKKGRGKRGKGRGEKKVQPRGGGRGKGERTYPS